MVIAKLPEVEFVEAATLSSSERGEGGFGSTGKE
jgi:dUTPase